MSGDMSDDPLLSYLATHSRYKEGFIRLPQYNQVFNTSCVTDYMERIEQFPVNQDDVWITSFPKCGTTWTEEMVWCIVNGINTDTRTLDERIPFFEMTAISDPAARVIVPLDTFQQTMDCPTPRYIKSHLMYDMLPIQAREKNVKMIHVTRNPRDVVVSLYNHWRIFGEYSGTFEKFCELFINDRAGYYGAFFPNVLSYWTRRENENILFLTYEEMKRDLGSVIHRTAEFLDKKLTKEDVSKLCAHLSFTNMKNNTAVNKQEILSMIRDANPAAHEESAGMKFMRKGIVGDWRSCIRGQMLAEFEEWEKRGMRDSDIQFLYE